MSRWEGRVALVTGASRGIGREIAQLAARRGAAVGLLARTQADLDAVAAELPGDHHAVAVDVSDRVALLEAIASVETTLGPVDVLVNNAGIGSYSAVVETDDDVYERLMRVNYLGGCVWPTKAVLPGMCRRRRGHIVNVASIAGRIGAPFEAAYSATKFAMVGFTESLVVEAAPFDVRLSLVDPGAVETEFFERRGHAYERSFPKAIPATRVARTVIDVVERDRSAERVVPRFLRPAYLIAKLAPALARSGTAKTFSHELDALRDRFDAGADRTR